MGKMKELYIEAMEQARGDESKIMWLRTGDYIIMPSDKEIRGFQKLMNASNIGRF